MTDRTEDQTDGTRRGFLKLAVAAPAVAAATVAGTDAASANGSGPQAGPYKGLADTEHTRAYFASARF